MIRLLDLSNRRRQQVEVRDCAAAELVTDNQESLLLPELRRTGRRRLKPVLSMVFCCLTFTALAHGNKPESTSELWQDWEFDPGVIVPLILSAYLYLRGLAQLWSHRRFGHGIRWYEALSFAGGWLAVFVALVSPLHDLGLVLFSAHMLQHELLMLVAAPCIVLGRPLIVFLKALPPPWAGRLARATHARSWQMLWKTITYPFVAWLLFAFALWIWHAPPLFQATIDNDWIHTLQHTSFFSSAMLFWWAILKGRQRLMGYGMAVLYMFTTALHSGLLGALLTFATSVIYPVYQPTTSPWGLSPLEDQQLGGLIMWVPAGLIHVIAGLALFAGWLRESDLRAIAWEGRAKAELLAASATDA